MYQWTTEAVSRGHPDKVADQISDAVLDAYLRMDPQLHVACECMVMKDLIVVSGEVSPCDQIDTETVVRNVLRRIGYDRPEHSYDGNTVEILNKLNIQSPEIVDAVAKAGGDIGAGDQGIMFGYATKATKTFMPLAHHLAFKFINALEADIDRGRGAGQSPQWSSILLPDAKSQITIRFEDDGTPYHVDTVVISSQHRQGVTVDELRDYIESQIVPNVIEVFPALFTDATRYLINPGGAWRLGGPAADTGLTGRKIVIDNYGADCPIGGGAFSGKDPTKVDRSAAYAARYLAKNVVAAGLADSATIQLSYTIGVRQPTSVRVVTPSADFDDALGKKLQQLLDLSPQGIINKFDLRRPIYSQTAAGGHFGREGFPWEELSLVEILKGEFPSLAE